MHPPEDGLDLSHRYNGTYPQRSGVVCKKQHAPNGTFDSVPFSPDLESGGPPGRPGLVVDRRRFVADCAATAFGKPGFDSFECRPRNS